MPIYKYNCTKNPKHVSEQLRGFEDEVTRCPTCNAPATRAPFSGGSFGFSFKGGSPSGAQRSAYSGSKK